MPRPTEPPKSITIVVAGSGDQRYNIDMPRGATVRDVLQQLNLSGHLRKVDDPSPFGENEEIYSRVHDGEKLILAPHTPVAEGG